MAGRKFVAGSSSSSSSLTPELFGSKDSYPPSCKDIHDSIFGPPPSKVLRRESVLPGMKHKANQDSKANNTSYPGVDNDAKKREDEKGDEKDSDWWMSQTKGIQQPCQLSSSIYYGGQEFYPYSPLPQTSGATYKSDGVENPDVATRGNWWQGSLYY